MADTAADKTEQPTPKRLGDARSKGQVPQSQELTSVVTLLVLISMIALFSPNLMQWMQMEIKDGMSCQVDFFSDSKAFLEFVHRKLINLGFIISPILAVLCVGSLAAGIAVGGFNFAPSALEFKFNQLNPVAGLGKLVNMKSFVRLLVSIIKLFLVSFIVWFYLHDKLEVFAKLRYAWTGQMLVAIAEIILSLVIRVGIALLVVAIADAYYQKWSFKRELRMTKQEVKQERKDTEGSPEVKVRIRRIQFGLAAKRMLKEVPKADVVLVNPTHVAVALRYEGKMMDAPVMVAKGADHLAEKIKEIARAYGVPIVRRPELARTIYST
ncbi:MAG: EscU/YscU/HrcU family type III secretion system export apparatus switch protein, partial [Sedimentisphaerales bacterium]|nr:EscU/YscU/HrcU family type III secretion system export apparatus switch protein [Sedimentisphaerales bacterium]